MRTAVARPPMSLIAAGESWETGLDRRDECSAAMFGGKAINSNRIQTGCCT